MALEVDILLFPLLSLPSMISLSNPTSLFPSTLLLSSFASLPIDPLNFIGALFGPISGSNAISARQSAVFCGVAESDLRGTAAPGRVGL